MQMRCAMCCVQRWWRASYDASLKRKRASAPTWTLSQAVLG
jgi:hypothetical protein